MKNIWIIVLTLCLFLIGGCADDDDPSQQIPKPGDLPLLSDGNHISFIKGFNATQPAITNTAMDAKWTEAISSGMDVGRIQTDWLELEPQPNQFNKQLLKDKLIAIQTDGLQPFVLVTTIDSEGYTLPTDLTDSATSTFLANNMELDDPIILGRFRKLLDWLVPMVVDHGGWGLSVGNEPGNFLIDYPTTEQKIVNFLADTRTHAHTIAPNLAITMTLAFGHIEQGNTFHVAFIEQSDVASFNYYSTDINFYFENGPTTVQQEIDLMLNIAGTKQIIIQELGSPGGYENKTSPMNASLTGQQLFFETVFKKMETEPRFRVAVIFQLVDWDPTLVDSLYTQPFIQEGLPRDFIDRFAESLETTGLIRYNDGSSRPAWSTVVNQIKIFSK